MFSRFAFSLAFALFGLISASDCRASDQLIVCGGPEVFIVPADLESLTAADRVWRWTAADSPEIPADFHPKFRTTDDCKPVGEAILITSSSGGVALIQRSDKRCLFYTSATNAHSACLLPDQRVAVAASYGGDALLIYSLKESGADLKPLASLELLGAHGVLWDQQRQRIWALGDDELLLIEMQSDGECLQLIVENRWNLPTHGGHDLMPGRDGKSLLVTTNTAVYRFDTRSSAFVPFEPLATAKKIKSIDEHPQSGRVVYHQADTTSEVWWSDKIRFLDPDGVVLVANERLYKVRWDVEMKFSILSSDTPPSQ